ncbi:restriction endonuclease subunit S [Shewanella sp. NKUCC06_TVS]|uniref:restriction endonuclease subunit S n=1 Tax=Shewanella sp. NKUCC06_TVS TaxID=2842128 RepID=UPI001C5BE3CB|nr:restriction endonuclease subunit S [Shewanella sp. NKUCC06_TVS]MBW3532430.1 restriction endonuclease subunit S [Shewanella sp. NKUCC06_TVS]
MSSDWKTLTLNEIVNFGNGKARPKTEGNIPIYGGNGILGYSGDSNYQEETIIIGRVGAYCGATYFENNPIWVSDNALSAKAKEGFIAKYAYYVLKSKNLNQYAQGSSHPLLTQGLLNKLEAYVTTNLEAQEKIVSIIGEIEDKIGLNTQTNQTLEQIAQALFKSWFVDFDPVKAKIETLAAGGSADDVELAAMSVISAKTLDELNGLKTSNPEAFNKLAQTAALFPAAMQDSELGEIPEGWEVKLLSEICQVINGRAYKNTEFKTEGTPIVRIQNLSNGGKTVYSDLELPPEKYIDREEFIYAWSATFGPHIWRGPKSIYHYHIWKMKVDESVISRYFLYLSMFRKTEAMKNAGTGSIFTHLTKKIMESQHVLVGDKAINKKFSDIIVPIFNQISSLKEESSYFAEIRDALLPKLLTGDDLTSEKANV